MAKRNYPRTAALLGAQPSVARQQQGSGRAAQTDWAALRIPWRALLPTLLFTAALLWLWLDPAWYVDATRIHVAGSAVAETRRDVALAGQVLGLHGLWLRPSTVVSEVLAGVPVVLHAEVSHSLYPASCTIAIQEREPVLTWITAEGAVWVDAEGLVLPVRDERADLPVIRGPLPEGERVPQAVLEGVAALEALALPEGAWGYHPQRGLLWYSPGGPIVAFGLGREMALRWQLCERMLEALRAQGITPRAVDVRFLNAPVYSLTDAW